MTRAARIFAEGLPAPTSGVAPGTCGPERDAIGAPCRRTRTGNRVHSSAEYNRGWRAANMAAGNCRDCKLPRLPNRVRCEKCLKLHAGWEAARRAKRALLRAASETEACTSAGRVCLMSGQESIGERT